MENTLPPLPEEESRQVPVEPEDLPKGVSDEVAVRENTGLLDEEPQELAVAAPPDFSEVEIDAEEPRRLDELLEFAEDVTENVIPESPQTASAADQGDPDTLSRIEKLLEELPGKLADELRTITEIG